MRPAIRVLTLNLWGLSGDWPARRSVLVAGLRDLRPDLIAIQEPVKTDDYDRVRELLGRHFHIAYQTGGRRGDSAHEGTAIASRWPIDAVHQLDLHLTPRAEDFPCATLAAKIAAPEPIGPLLFVNHLPSWQRGFEHEREVQAVAAARFIEELAGDGVPVVVAGDLDAEPGAASVRFWTGRQSLSGVSVCYVDAWETARPADSGHTVSPRNPLRGDGATPLDPARRIDYILVRCGRKGRPTLPVAACALAFDEPLDGVWASDHFGVVADLLIR